MTKTDVLKLVVLLFLPGWLRAQKNESIHFARDSDRLIFFQKGVKKDTLPEHSEFYLLVPSLLKGDLSIQIDNASLTTINDSTATLDHRPGLAYESYYLNKGSVKKPEWTFRVGINGTSPGQTNEVTIRFVDKVKQEILLENKFIIRP